MILLAIERWRELRLSKMSTDLHFPSIYFVRKIYVEMLKEQKL